ncbi:AIM24 family protein [Peribacillus psychrosaccharolyticus]|uniref:AIM24 family protein n=1 Tax=Peribacillus psychrosaccharolyticus TaxID=1407 RepID=A0A974NM57_PERPY|nr:AIM24 family protein [Peribacillus psychrosaccharolyticus]MEC2056636.1 AIM24 family protein [Peribacillus psychrosaccharolyticus]MED3745768.1 AIM24 family protein [Peribacillus psychrosaccharolyticus]QQT00232.1 AIM24 family protein [Peribacillus psychrosaccharolyticus]
MEKYHINEFISKTKQQDKGQGLFELETDRILEINLENQIWAKTGSMISYRGNIKFEREGILEHGLGKMFKKAFTGEGASIMKATGQGKLYVADQGKKISILNLADESICINGNDLLAFEPRLKWDIKLMRKIAGVLAGGLFNVKVEGTGMVAFTTHYEPLTLLVEPGDAVYTDPNATVAWSGHLTPDFVTDVSLKTFFGRGSGESVQMKFEGSGFVVVQPFEEVYFSEKQ